MCLANDFVVGIFIPVCFDTHYIFYGILLYISGLKLIKFVCSALIGVVYVMHAFETQTTTDLTYYLM